jgi:uncharacterized protein YkwD
MKDVNVIAGVVLGLFTGYVLGELGHSPAPKATPAVTVQAAQPVPTAAPDPHGLFTYDNVLIRVNEARLRAGLPQLYDDQYLSSEAQKDVSQNCPVKSHDYFRKEAAAGDFSKYVQVAEDLASGDLTPTQSVSGLLESPTHADIMVGKENGWTRLGIGIETSPVNCVSLIFGK